MMFIHHGPPQQLSEDQQRELWAAWTAVRETPGVTPGMQLGAPGTATVVRQGGAVEVRPLVERQAPPV